VTAQKVETVTLFNPKGQRVTVAASKQDARLAAGYSLPKRKRAPSKAKPAPVND
jgi:hypothetical protein